MLFITNNQNQSRHKEESSPNRVFLVNEYYPPFNSEIFFPNIILNDKQYFSTILSFKFHENNYVDYHDKFTVHKQ